MKKTCTAAVLLCLFALPALAGTVTLTGKLVDRQCSVEDTFQYQPQADRYCKLWLKETFSCPAGTCTAIYTIYCPNKAADGRSQNLAYDVCSDGSAMQILHPTANYTILAFPRTPEQQADGLGQFQGYGFSY